MAALSSASSSKGESPPMKVIVQSSPCPEVSKYVFVQHITVYDSLFPYHGASCSPYWLISICSTASVLYTTICGVKLEAQPLEIKFRSWQLGTREIVCLFW